MPSRQPGTDNRSRLSISHRSNFRSLEEAPGRKFGLMDRETESFLTWESLPAAGSGGAGIQLPPGRSLDMRMDPDRELTAYEMWSTIGRRRRLPEFCRNMGEERFARRIAGRFVERRRRVPIRTTRELAESSRNPSPLLPAVADPIPPAARFRRSASPSTMAGRVFLGPGPGDQAVRKAEGYA